MTELVIRILGPGWLTVDGEPLESGGPRQRSVLAALLLAYPGSVSLDLLIDAVWGDHPPVTAAATIQAYISRLRRLLAPLGCAVNSTFSAYSLQIGAAWFDLEIFTAEIEAAHAAAHAGRHREVVRRLESGLPLWHPPGPVGLVDDRSILGAEVTAIEQRYWGARRLLAAAYLAMGRPDAAAGTLEQDLENQPYDEGIAADLILALYRSGRTAAALTTYQRLRSRMRDELGLDPSHQLEDLHQAVLRSDPVLDWKLPLDLRAHTLLPARNPCFVGRDDMLKELEKLLGGHQVVALFGLAGCGKTDVALELAHRRQGLSLWVNAQDAASLFAGFLDIARTMGIEQEMNPHQMLVALWEELNRHGDWLVVIDNAADMQALRQTLPAGKTGRFVITSQNPAWQAFGPTVKVPPFETYEAVDFIIRRSGRTDRTAALQLAEVMGNMPLALEQACAYVEETGLELTEYLAHFQRSHHRLLTRGAPAGHGTDVAASWQLLFNRVREQSALAAQILEVAAFLSPDGVPVRMLEVLSSGDAVALTEAVVPLLSFSLIAREDGELRMHRLVQTVVRSGLTKQERRIRAGEALTAVLSENPGDPQSPQEWAVWSVVSTQLVALLGCAEGDEAPSGLAAAALDSVRYYRAHGALQSARQVLDKIQMLIADEPPESLIVAQWRLEQGNLLDAEGNLDDARALLEQAVARLRGPDAPVDDLLMARTVTRLAHARNCSGNAADAVALYLDGIAVLRSRDDRMEESQALIGLGYTYWSLKKYAQGERCFEQALSTLEQSGWSRHPLFAEALSGRGMMRHEQGRLQEAHDDQLLALSLLKSVHGDHNTAQVAETRDKLGFVLGLMGQWNESRDQHQAAADSLALLFGDRTTRYATALANLGLAETALGKVDQGFEHQTRALQILVDSYGAGHPTAEVIAQRLSANHQDA